MNAAKGELLIRLLGALRRTVFWFIFLAVICFAIPASVRGQFQALQPPAEKEIDLSPQQRKIQGLVRSTIARLRAEGVDRSIPAGLNAAPRSWELPQ